MLKKGNWLAFINVFAVASKKLRLLDVFRKFGRAYAWPCNLGEQFRLLKEFRRMGFCEVIALIVLKAHVFAGIEFRLASHALG